MRNHLFTAAVLLLAVLAGCSGAPRGNALSPALQAADPAGSAGTSRSGAKPDLRGLPALPSGRRSSGLLETSVNGDETFSRSASTLEAPPLLQISSAAGQLGWAIWELPATDELRYLDIAMTVPPGQQAWLALADYSTGRWQLEGPVVSGRVLTLDPSKHSSPGGQLYAAVLAYDGASVSVGKLSLLAFHSNTAPSADLQADLTSGQAPVFIDLSASASSDPDPGDSIVRFFWDFNGDGQFETVTFEPLALHQFTEAGVFDVEVVVEDRDGATDSATVQITITPANLPPSAGLSIFPNETSLGNEASFDASVSADSDGSIVLYEFDWNGDGIYDISTDNPVRVEQLGAAGSFRVGLRVTDDQGASATATALLRVHGFNQSDTFFDMNSDAGDHSSLELINGRPAIAFYDSTLGRLRYVRAVTDGFPTFWGTPVTVDADDAPGRFNCLSEINGRPAISYYADDTGRLRYCRALDADGAAWGAPQDLTSSGDQGRYTCLRTVNGNPAISFQDADNEFLGYVRALDADGTSWGTPQYPANIGQAGYYSSMQVMDGKPGICYYDLNGNDLRIVVGQDADGDNWSSLINVVAGAGDTGAYCSMAIVNGFYPAIAYRDGSVNSVCYVRSNSFDGTSWGLPQTLDTSGADTGYFASLAVVQGYPSIAYYDDTNDQLRYIQSTDLDGNGWPAGFSIVDQNGTGRFCSLKEIYGGPAISYYSDLLTDLKYVSGF